jgi:hypothetical protein
MAFLSNVKSNLSANNGKGRVITGESGKTYRIVTGRDMCEEKLEPNTRQFFEQLMDIDRQVFGGDDKGDDCVYVGDVSGYIDRFGYVEKDGEMVYDPNAGVADNIVAIMEDDKVIGYINYLTMSDELKDMILHPDFEYLASDPEGFAESRDDGITGSQLRQWQKGGENNLFILTTAIDKEHQDSEVIKLLTNSFLEELRGKAAEGYEITSISNDTVSDHGEDIARMFRCDMAKGEDGKDLILPAPESDESGHDVHVRICEGENIKLLLEEGFDFERPRLAKLNRQKAAEELVADIQTPETPVDGFTK